MNALAFLVGRHLCLFRLSLARLFCDIWYELCTARFLPIAQGPWLGLLSNYEQEIGNLT